LKKKYFIFYIIILQKRTKTNAFQQEGNLKCPENF